MAAVGQRVAAVVVLAFASAATAAWSPPATTSSHRLIVTVKKNLPPAAEKKLAVLVLISHDGGAPAGAVATASKPLTVLLARIGFYRVKAQIDTSCSGSCAASYRISGAAKHKLEVIPACRPKGSGFACSKVRIVRLY